MRKPTTDLMAYDYVLRSLKWWHTTTPEDHALGRDLLEKAVALDPNYAQAHAHLANAYVNEFVFGFNPRPDPLGRALASAKRAVELDPSYAFAHYILARCYYYEMEDTLFEAEAETALSLNPNDADALADIGNMYGLSFARLQEGSDMAARAMRLNPHHPGFYRYAMVFQTYFEGRYQETLAELRKTGTAHWAVHVWYALTHAMLGDSAAARAESEKALALKPDFTARWYLDHRRFHASLREPFVDGAAKAGLPLGDGG